MVYGDGREFPSVFKTVKVIVRIVVEGNGSDKYIKGSNVTETFLQTGQTSVDLYWPCRKIIIIIKQNNNETEEKY